jgi:hypothetical protein
MSTRRVVTGIDADGKSYFVHDGPTPASIDLGRIAIDDVWVDDPANPDPDALVDPVAGDNLTLVGPPGGSVIRVGTFWPPDRADMPSEDAITADMARWDAGTSMEEGDDGWHTTATIDYGVVITGQVDLGLDSGWVRLGPGDVVVQRATRHAWRQVGDEPCKIAWILLSSPNYE